MVSTHGQEILAKSHTSDNDDNEVVLCVNGVSKKFCRDLKRSLFYGVQDIASEVLGLREKSDKLRSQEFWALNNVSFELRRGEALGLVGKNGSGKSTMLRIIAGLIKPDTGFVEVNGRVAPLIALGAGFNPILTGRENIYANMSILGLSKKEIEERFDQVVEFAEIGDAIDAPVRSYSSGMAARLGFASAIHTEPDILLIDEVLAVGDVRFRAKCHRKLQGLRNNGTSFILVSHNTQTIFNVCENSVYLTKGKVIASGDTNFVMQRYEKDLFLNEVVSSKGKMILPKKSISESLGLDILSLFFRNEKGEMIDSPVSGEPAYFCAKCKSNRNISNAGFSFAIREQRGEGDITLIMSSFNDNNTFEVSPGEIEMQAWMPYVCLKPSAYTMKVFVKENAFTTLDYVESFVFIVEGKEVQGHSLFYQPRAWKAIREQN